MSAVVSALRTYRERMDRLDAELMRSMGMRWLKVEEEIRYELEALAMEMAERQAAGETVTAAMIYQSERYQRLLAMVNEELRRYADDAAEIIAKYQERAAVLGIDAAKLAIMNSYPTAYAAVFDRIFVEAVESMIGFGGDGSPLWALLMNSFGLKATEGIVQALVSGLALGMSTKSIARRLLEEFGVNLERAMLIARTETQRAYRAGSVQQYRDSGVVTGFMRLVKKEGACLGCLLLDGEMFDLAQEMDDHPNGRCTVVPIVRGMEPPDWEKGPEWFENLSEAEQRRIMGDKRYELWKNGTPLSAFATKAHDDVWGDMPKPTPLGELGA